MADGKIKVKIVDPNRIVFEGEADYVMAPGRKHTLGILPGHTPMFAELVAGDLYIAGENEQAMPIQSGILKVRADEVTILIGIDG
jgi:F-type H+-transporting ATPase subunit epsilon